MNRATCSRRSTRLRQQLVKGNQEPSYAVADFVAPRESGRMDYLGMFAVTAGFAHRTAGREI